MPKLLSVVPIWRRLVLRNTRWDDLGDYRAKPYYCCERFGHRCHKTMVRAWYISDDLNCSKEGDLGI